MGDTPYNFLEIDIKVDINNVREDITTLLTYVKPNWKSENVVIKVSFITKGTLSQWVSVTALPLA